jgi:hypothetical protein
MTSGMNKESGDPGVAGFVIDKQSAEIDLNKSRQFAQ